MFDNDLSVSLDLQFPKHRTVDSLLFVCINTASYLKMV